MGLATALLVPLWLAASPLTTEQPDVRTGNELLGRGDPDGALQRFAAAERAVGARPEIDYDRGIALLRQGKTAEGLDALRRAAERGDGPLASRALQNAGWALDAAGDRDGAIRAFADALARDPENADARFNLEVLLRRRAERKTGGAKEEPERREAKAGQRDDERAMRGGSPDERGDRKAEPQRPQADQSKEGQRAGAADSRPRVPRGDTEGKGPAGRQEREQGGEAERGGGGEPTSRQDAERLLDAIRARERNLSPGAWQRREQRRRDVEKDW
jgi:Ca-activated chloride channel family protein